MIDETFATEISCVGGTTTNGATKSYAAELGVTGGACMICATSTGTSYFELTAVAAKSGQLELEAQARRPAGRTGPANVSVVLTFGGANVSNTKSIGENQWTRIGGTSVSVTNGATINLRIGMESAAVDDCILIDDVRVTIE